MLTANKAIRDNEVVNIYEMTVEDFVNVKTALEKLANIHLTKDPSTQTSVILDKLVDYFHFQVDMEDMVKDKEE